MAKFEDVIKELPSSVKKVLHDEGFDSIAALQCASESDIASLNLKVGHAALLRKVCVELQTSRQEGPMIRKDSEPLMDGLATLLGALKKPSAEIQDATATAGQSQCLRILDHIPSSMLVEEEVTLGGGVTLKINAKPKLDKISPAMWISANAKILSKLLARGDMAVEDYLNYNDMIGELAARFTWTSVVAFDDEYRQRQAATQFKWGTAAPHLCTVILREKTATNNQQSKKQGANSSGRRPVGASGKEVCLQYNRHTCHFGPRCQYEHSCITCGSKDHGSKDHPTTTPAPASSGQA